MARPPSVQLAYPFKFIEDAGSLISWEFLDQVNYFFPAGVSMTALSEGFQAMQVSS